ncbi:hypothetical protein [Rhodosalinus sp.]|uniref:hypothetical protein n=1 Tax=Rhodosalinus sp. TaxID=2047741 RepID=UPI00356146BD
MAGFMDALKRLSDRLGHAEGPSDADLADLGLTPEDYEVLVSGAPGARARIEAMAARFGVPATRMDTHRGYALLLAETCAHCGAAAACRKALERGMPLPEDRCPNAPIYRAMLG